MKKSIKLQQGQVWKLAKASIRIVRLERLEVEYKAIPTLTPNKATHHTVTKKEFCRLIKPAELLGPAITPTASNAAANAGTGG